MRGIFLTDFLKDDVLVLKEQGGDLLYSMHNLSFKSHLPLFHLDF